MAAVGKRHNKRRRYAGKFFQTLSSIFLLGQHEYNLKGQSMTKHQGSCDLLHTYIEGKLKIGKKVDSRKLRFMARTVK